MEFGVDEFLNIQCPQTDALVIRVEIGVQCGAYLHAAFGGPV